MKALLFRVDANPEIGMGHLMRCLSIADAARDAGALCTFLTADPSAAEVVTERGHSACVLTGGSAETYGTQTADTRAVIVTDDGTGTAEATVPEASRQENAETKARFDVSEIASLDEHLRNSDAAALIVDSYAVTEDYLKKLYTVCKERGTKLVYLDDLAAFAYPCDILINYNIFAPDWCEKYEKLYGTAGPKLLLGAEYAPLRKEFQSTQARLTRERAQDVLISTGGADAEHMGLALLREIGKRDTELVFHFVVGKMNRDAEELKGLAEQNENVRFHFDVSDMASLMRSCDAAISASGSTLCELCATQTPTLTYILADNQIAVAEGFTKRGVMRCCGDVRDTGADALAGTLIDGVLALCEDTKVREEISRAMLEVTDAHGAERIVSVFYEYKG